MYILGGTKCLNSPVEEKEVNRMSLIGYSLGEAYSVLGTQICWKSPHTIF